MQPSEKQIKYARTLGIEDPEDYDMKTLSKLIDKKLGNKPKNASDGSSQPTTARHDIVVSRTEKPHSYEFGKAGARHKIYYSTVEELQTMIQELEDANLVEKFEVEKPENFEG